MALAAVVSLAVAASAEPDFCEDFVIQAALLLQGNLVLELRDLFSQADGEPIGKELTPERIARFHRMVPGVLGLC
jgi:hypothetical protein